MALPTQGIMTASLIRTEYLGGNNQVKMSEYYRGGNYVPDVLANLSIPTSNEIKYSDFRGGDIFGVTMIIDDIIPESGSVYGNSNDGQVKIRFVGTPLSYDLTCDNGFKGTFNRHTTIPITGLNGSASRGGPHTLTIKDRMFNYTWIAYLNCGGGGASAVEDRPTGPGAKSNVIFAKKEYAKSAVIYLPKYGGGI